MRVYLNIFILFVLLATFACKKPVAQETACRDAQIAGMIIYHVDTGYQSAAVYRYAVGTAYTGTADTLSRNIPVDLGKINFNFTRGFDWLVVTKPNNKQFYIKDIVFSTDFAEDVAGSTCVNGYSYTVNGIVSTVHSYTITPSNTNTVYLTGN